MLKLDRVSIGRRIRQVRLSSSLRQWQLGKNLCISQAAVHKYEHGVIPEPRRLVELARIGETTVEWLLTGRHWENGSTEQRRLPRDLLSTAGMFHGTNGKMQEALDDALLILHRAIQTMEQDTSATIQREQTEGVLRLLEKALRIQRMVWRQLAVHTAGRLTDPSV